MMASPLMHYVNGTMIEIDGGQDKALMDRVRDRLILIGKPPNGGVRFASDHILYCCAGFLHGARRVALAGRRQVPGNAR